MLMRVRPSLARAAPRALAALSRGSSPPVALALAAARSTTALLRLQTQFSEQWQPRQPQHSLIFAGTLLGAVLSAEQPEAECAPKRKQTAPAPKAAAKQKAGPALSAIEKAMEPEKVYNVEKLIASRLQGGVKQYLVE